MKDHLQRDHLNIVDGIKATYYDDEDAGELMRMDTGR